MLGEIKANPEYKHIPVLMVTAEGAQAKVLKAVNLGAVGFVRKPFTADQIKEKLVDLLLNGAKA